MFLVQLVLGLALMILGYMLMPTPPEEKQEITEMESPTATSREIPWLFGDMWIKSPNFLGHWDKQYKNLEDDSGEKK
jgi:hypothetical protein